MAILGTGGGEGPTGLYAKSFPADLLSRNRGVSHATVIVWL